MTAMTPTKKQMLAVLKRRIEYSTYGGKEGDGPICDAIRSLIEHGDGGPKVTREWLGNFVHEIGLTTQWNDGDWDSEKIKSTILSELKKIGLTAEEE